MKTFITIGVTFAVTAALAAGAVVGLVKRGKLGTKEPTLVRVERPERGDLTEVVSARAEVEPKTKVEISARVSARIVELPYDEGDEVIKGDPDAEPPVPPSVLVRLDATDLRAALLATEAMRAAQAAQIGVERARLAGRQAEAAGLEASLAQARRTLERQVKLFNSDDVSQADIDASECRCQELEAQLEAARHNLQAAEANLVVLEHTLAAADAEIERARDNLSYTTITSPIDGVVTRLHAEEGEQAIPGTMNNPGTVIMQVADLDTMLLVAQVDETDVGRVEVGQRAVAEIHAYPDEEFAGTVNAIALTHDTGWGNTKYYRTEILLDLDGRRIRSGATSDVDIETEYHRDLLRVPSQAVVERLVDELPLAVREGNTNVDMSKAYVTAVYRVVGGKAVVTPVTIGASDETRTVIESGATEDDVVVVGPYKVLESIKHDDAMKDEHEAEAEKEPAEQEQEKD